MVRFPFCRSCSEAKGLCLSRDARRQSPIATGCGGTRDVLLSSKTQCLKGPHCHVSHPPLPLRMMKHLPGPPPYPPPVKTMPFFLSNSIQCPPIKGLCGGRGWDAESFNESEEGNELTLRGGSQIRESTSSCQMSVPIGHGGDPRRDP